MQTAIAENSRTALDQNEYERRYADLAERYNTIKSEYDKISEQIESKKAQRELFKVFIRALEKQGALLEEFDEGLPCMEHIKHRKVGGSLGFVQPEAEFSVNLTNMKSVKVF